MRRRKRKPIRIAAERLWQLAAVILVLTMTLKIHSNMRELVARAYTGKFETEHLTPTVSVGEYHVLELFRGPTSAFKDVALCMLPQLLTAAKTEKGMNDDILILTATSGDTGKAAMEGFADVPQTKIMVFYPVNGVSNIQKKQMASQKGNNVDVVSINGNFDEALETMTQLAREKYLYLLNSINPFRLEGQKTIGYEIVHDLGWESPDRIVLPVGNAGNISAIWKGITEFHNAGFMDDVPMMTGIQAEGEFRLCHYLWPCRQPDECVW